MNEMRRKLLIAGLGMLLAGAFVFYLFPRRPFDSRRVEPRLLQLQIPYRSVYADRFRDGGSICIMIVDRDGRSESFAIPERMSPQQNNGKVFVGATSDRSPKAVEVKDSEQTKLMLSQVLASMPQRTAQDDFIIAVLSQRLDDGIRSVVRDWINQYF